jgi:hypothetical protein
MAVMLAAPALADPPQDPPGQRGRSGKQHKDQDKQYDEQDREDQEAGKDLEEMDRELRKAEEERDRELRKAREEADREGKPEKYEQKKARIQSKFEEKRRQIRARFDEKARKWEKKHGRPFPGRGPRWGVEPDRPAPAIEPDRPAPDIDPDRRTPQDIRRALAEIDEMILEENETHAARLKQLRQARQKAEKLGDEQALRRIDQMIARETERHERRMSKLQARRESLLKELKETRRSPRPEKDGDWIEEEPDWRRRPGTPDAPADDEPRKPDVDSPKRDHPEDAVRNLSAEEARADLERVRVALESETERHERILAQLQEQRERAETRGNDDKVQRLDRQIAAENDRHDARTERLDVRRRALRARLERLREKPPAPDDEKPARGGVPDVDDRRPARDDRGTGRGDEDRSREADADRTKSARELRRRLADVEERIEAENRRYDQRRTKLLLRQRSDDLSTEQLARVALELEVENTRHKELIARLTQRRDQLRSQLEDVRAERRAAQTLAAPQDPTSLKGFLDQLEQVLADETADDDR